MPKGRPKKGGRVVATNIKITKETHEQLQEAASLLGKSQSEIIQMGLSLLLPELSQAKEQREKLERSVQERLRKASEN